MFRIGVDKLNPLWYNKEKKKGENQMIILEVMAGLTLLAISYVAEQLYDEPNE